ncbi:type I-F CRISPR-associated endoribonuclease Cas6/Csy4 [Nostoc sp. CHAB 5834]|nr:type I-F CRISPR-associated endoribonuclease Cas6/Csy4 [Nostoc sp. CHAB 5834]
MKASTSHFVSIAIPETKGVACDWTLVSALLAAVHSFNSENGNVLGFDVPHWKAGQAPKSVKSVRIFGAESALQAFFSDMRGRRLSSVFMVGVESIRPVPATAISASVSRDTTAEASRPTAVRRREKRAAARGEQASPFEANRHFCELAIPLRSKSTDRNFMLKLKKREVKGAAPVAFSSYGLCVSGGVPQFE